MTLTVTPDSTHALFELHINYLTEVGVQTSATIYRSLFSTGPWEEIRTVDLLGQQAYQFDNTAPLDVDVWYRTVAQDGTEMIDGPSIIVTGGGAAWLRDPGRPWADIEMSFCETAEPTCEPVNALSWVGFGTFGRPTDASLFEILNAEKPADIYARRKNLSTEINMFSNTLLMKNRVYELFTAGGPLFLQLPPVYGWADDFIQTTSDLTEDYVDRRDQRRPWRRWAAPVRTVGRPQGPIQGTPCANWCEVDGAFGTFADMTAAGGTWADVATGDLVCPPGVLSGYGAGGYGEGPYGD